MSIEPQNVQHTPAHGQGRWRRRERYPRRSVAPVGGINEYGDLRLGQAEAPAGAPGAYTVPPGHGYHGTGLRPLLVNKADTAYERDPPMPLPQFPEALDKLFVCHAFPSIHRHTFLISENVT